VKDINLSYAECVTRILIHSCILLDFLGELYCDARIHEHQVDVLPIVPVNRQLLPGTPDSFQCDCSRCSL